MTSKGLKNVSQMEEERKVGMEEGTEGARAISCNHLVLTTTDPKN